MIVMLVTAVDSTALTPVAVLGEVILRIKCSSLSGRLSSNIVMFTHTEGEVKVRDTGTLPKSLFSVQKLRRGREQETYTTKNQ